MYRDMCRGINKYYLVKIRYVSVKKTKWEGALFGPPKNHMSQKRNDIPRVKFILIIVHCLMYLFILILNRVPTSAPKLLLGLGK